MKTGFKLFSRLLINAMMGLFLAVAVGVPASAGAAVVVGASIVSGNFLPNGSACAGVYTEIWTGELIKKLRAGITVHGWTVFPTIPIKPKTILFTLSTWAVIPTF